MKLIDTLKNRPDSQMSGNDADNVNPNPVNEPEHIADNEGDAETAPEAGTPNDDADDSCIGSCFDLIVDAWKWIFFTIVLALVCWFAYVIYEERYYASPSNDDVSVSHAISIGKARHWPFGGQRIYRNDDHRILVWGSEYMRLLDDGVTLVYDINDTLHLLNCQQGTFIPGAFKDLFYSGDGLISVRTFDEKLSIIDTEGKIVFDKIGNWNRQEIPVFEFGYATFYSDNGDGLLNTKGQWVIKPGEYSSITVESDLCKVWKNGATGIYDLDSARLIVPCLYDELYSIEPNCIVVEKCAERTFVTGKTTYHGDIVMETIQPLGSGMYSYLCKGNYGLLSEVHGIVTPPIYTAITCIGDNILCRKGDNDLDHFKPEDFSGFPEPVD